MLRLHHEANLAVSDSQHNDTVELARPIYDDLLALFPSTSDMSVNLSSILSDQFGIST